MSEPKPAFGPTAEQPKQAAGTLAPAPAFPVSSGVTASTPKSIEPQPVFAAATITQTPAPQATQPKVTAGPAAAFEPSKAPNPPATPSQPPAASAPAPAPAFAPTPPKPVEPPSAVTLAMNVKMKANRQPERPAASAAFPQQATARSPILEAADKALMAVADTEVVRLARRCVVTLSAIPLTDLRALLDYGKDVQTVAAAIPNRLLDLVRCDAADEINTRLGRIREHVENTQVDDLLAPKRGIINLARKLVSPRDRLDETIRAVEVEVGAVQSHLPLLLQRLTEVESAVTEERTTRINIEAHIQGGQIVLAHYASTLPAPSDAERRGLETLQERVDALRMTRLTGQTDANQLDLLRQNIHRLSQTAQSVVTDLVALWKRHCVAAMTLLADRNPAPSTLSSVSRGMTDARTKIIAAISAARR